MTKIITTSVFCLLFLQLLTAQPNENTQNMEYDFEKVIMPHVEKDFFEGNILIAEKGEIIYQQSFGMADREKEQNINMQTRFSIASITKMITAIVTLQLIEEGHFNFNSNLNELLPEFNIPNDKKISIHHLLLHISGLPKEPEGTYAIPRTPKNFVETTLENKKSALKLGEYQYANIDYVLLGLIIEKYTSGTWEEAIKERIIEKLNLNNTGFLKKDAYPENFAYSYHVQENGKFVKDPEFYIENFYAAACMYSTTEDLLKLDQAMHDNTLLSNGSKEKMFTSYPEYNYTGYSVWTYNYFFAATNPRIMERRGGIMGSNCVLARMLDTNKTLIILSNNNRFNPDSFGDKNNLREGLLIELGKK